MALLDSIFGSGLAKTSEGFLAEVKAQCGVVATNVDAALSGLRQSLQQLEEGDPKKKPCKKYADLAEFVQGLVASGIAGNSSNAAYQVDAYIAAARDELVSCCERTFLSLECSRLQKEECARVRMPFFFFFCSVFFLLSQIATCPVHCRRVF